MECLIIAFATGTLFLQLTHLCPIQRLMNSPSLPSCSVECVIIAFATGTLFLQLDKVVAGNTQQSLSNAQLFMAVAFLSINVM